MASDDNKPKDESSDPAGPLQRSRSHTVPIQSVPKQALPLPFQGQRAGLRTNPPVGGSRMGTPWGPAQPQAPSQTAHGMPSSMPQPSMPQPSVPQPSMHGYPTSPAQGQVPLPVAPPPAQPRVQPEQRVQPEPLPVVSVQAATPYREPAIHASHAAVIPPQPMLHDHRAIQRGLGAASDAALAPDTERPARAQGAAREGLELLWLHEEVSRLLRRRSEWRELLDERDLAEAEDDARLGLDDEPEQNEGRAEAYLVLTKGQVATTGEIERALSDSLRGAGRFSPTTLLLEGATTFDFDEVAQLKAALAVASPFAKLAPELEVAVASGAAILSAPGGIVTAEAASEAAADIRSSYANLPKIKIERYDEQVERALLLRRAFQRRDVFGALCVRGLFRPEGDATSMPIYFSESIAKKLPLYRTLPMRVVIETHFQVDPYEASPMALRAVVMARSVRG